MPICLKQLVATTKLAPVLNHLSERENNESSRSQILRQDQQKKQNKKTEQSNNNKTLVLKLER